MLIHSTYHQLIYSIHSMFFIIIYLLFIVKCHHPPLQSKLHVDVVYVLSIFFFNFYLFMIVTERERERRRDTGRGRSRLHAPGARCGIRSWVSRIAPWAKGRRLTAAPPRHPYNSIILLFILLWNDLLHSKYLQGRVWGTQSLKIDNTGIPGWRSG